LAIGQNNCTGGGVFTGFLPNGTVQKFTGIYIDDTHNQLAFGF